MQTASFTPWPKTYQEAVALQEELRRRVRLLPLPRPPRLVAGADAISDREDRCLFGAVAVYRFPEMELLEEAEAEAECPFPYRTGLLSFREVPILAAAFRRLKSRPEVLLVDGQGIAHPWPGKDWDREGRLRIEVNQEVMAVTPQTGDNGKRREMGGYF